MTTVGRAIFNDEVSRALEQAVGERFKPTDYAFQNRTFTKRDMTEFISELVDRCGATAIAEVLDTIKELGFSYATRAGVTISKNDILIPPDKEEILVGYEEQVGKRAARRTTAASSPRTSATSRWCRSGTRRPTTSARR